MSCRSFPSTAVGSRGDCAAGSSRRVPVGRSLAAYRDDRRRGEHAGLLEASGATTEVLELHETPDSG